MCRHLAYLGPPVTLEELLVTPEHSLLQQASEPRLQTHGKFNGDGFGVGWYTAERAEPARYRRSDPMWTDASFLSFAGTVRAAAVLAAVRAASPGMPIDESANAPFTAEAWLFSHNGAIIEFRSGAGVELRRAVSDRRANGILGGADSEVVFALVLDRLDAGAAPADALADVVKRVEELSPARLNLLLTDGRALTATAAGNSLFTRVADDAVVVASEPFDDDPAWAAVADRSIVHASPGAVAVSPL